MYNLKGNIELNVKFREYFFHNLTKSENEHAPEVPLKNEVMSSFQFMVGKACGVSRLVLRIELNKFLFILSTQKLKWTCS